MLIGQILLNEEKIEQLIQDIKERKTLQDLHKDFVRDQLFEYLNKNHKLASSLNQKFHPRSAIYKKVLKDVRSQLRRVYGLYRTTIEGRQRQELIKELLEKPETGKTSETGDPSSTEPHLKTTPILSSTNLHPKIMPILSSMELHPKISSILQTHSSTKERLSFYPQLYSKIFKITKKPMSIIDLGCGINPFSIPFMGLKKLNYYAYDISEEEITALNDFFHYVEQNNSQFWGIAKLLDTLTWEEIERHKKSDLCFLFKMTDVLDRGRGHKVSEEVITKVPAKYVVVSFSTKTMSGKPMNFPERKWIELMCQRLKYSYKTLSFSNEIFYVIKKK